MLPPRVMIPLAALLLAALTGCTAPADPGQSQTAIVDAAVSQLVQAKGSEMCQTLDLSPEMTVESELANYVAGLQASGVNEEMATTIGKRFLTGAAAEFCPEQSARVAAGVA